jgi:hypothetical protein
MKNAPIDGGPAFPVAGYDHQALNPKTLGDARRLLSGMSMRQHYAGLAMQGMVSSIHSEEGYRRLRAIAADEGLTVSQWIARDSFKQADAMLSAGDQPGELERVTAERDTMARAILQWWEANQLDTGAEPAFVTQAIELGIDP